MREWRRVARAAVPALLAGVLATAQAAAAQAVTAVPNLDLNRFTGVWYEIARYPDKMEKHCVSNDTILYALGNKRDSFQMGVFCQAGDGNSDEWSAHGKLDKQRNGKLKVTHLWPFKKKFWVMALAPDYQWAVVGSPNHAVLWILSRTASMPPGQLASLEASASAAGFDPAKLKAVSQHH